MADRPLRICCVVSTLAGGGAERVMSLLANQWAAQGQNVAIVTLSRVGGDEYSLDHRVLRVGLGVEAESNSLMQAVLYNALKIRGLRRAVAGLDPDVVISFVDRVNVLTIFACIGLPVTVIVSERTYPASYNVGKAWSVLRRVFYRLADALVVQSSAARKWAQTVMPMARIHVIPNPVGGEFLSTAVVRPSARESFVLGVGRLSPEKGFDVLIRAFHVVAERHAQWSLFIIGEGPEDAALRRLASELLRPGAAAFPGAVRDPERYYRVAGLFVLPSRFEGFPNALLEAMAAGCAVIATDSPGGTSEIVRQGVDGVLVPPENVAALAGAMDRLMTDEGERRRLGAQAAEVSGRFALAKVAKMWDCLIADLRR
jgi:glycosyltransferase involved in cell wall biosynthesis